VGAIHIFLKANLQGFTKSNPLPLLPHSAVQGVGDIVVAREYNYFYIYF
jgi:hypothetical protein